MISLVSNVTYDKYAYLSGQLRTTSLSINRSKQDYSSKNPWMKGAFRVPPKLNGKSNGFCKMSLKLTTNPNNNRVLVSSLQHFNDLPRSSFGLG